MRQQQPGHRRRTVPFGRPLLAWRTSTQRGASEIRALFAVHSTRPELIAAWHRGDSLDAAKAQQLWAAHHWQLISPPSDVAALLASNQPLAAAQKQAAA